jgi:hypothetical protein
LKKQKKLGLSSEREEGSSNFTPPNELDGTSLSLNG